MEIQDERKQNIYQKVEAECQKSSLGLKIKQHDVIQIAEKQKWIDQNQLTGYKIDYLQLFEITSNLGDFYLVVPWSGNRFLPYEIFSVCDGNLPQAIALKKGTIGSKWHTSDSVKNEKLFNTLMNNNKLEKGIKWEYQGSTLDFKTTIDWAVQAVPLKNNQFLFFIQSSPMSGSLSTTKFILDLFLEKKQVFIECIKSIDYKEQSDSSFVAPVKSLLVINKKYPEIYKKLPSIGENEITDSIITEFEYNELLDNLAQKMVSRINEAGGAGKADSKQIGAEVREEEKDVMDKLIKYQIITQGISDADKVSKKVHSDLRDKLVEKMSGVDEKGLQKMGCVALFVSLIPIVFVWVAIPESIHWGVKIFLSIVGFALTFWGCKKYFESKIEQKQKQN